MLYQVKAMNTAGGNGVSKAYMVDGNVSVASLMEDERFSGILVGNNIFAFNGATLDATDLHKTIEELGANANTLNVIASIKPANGAKF